jgi:hypothetical protein
VATKKSKTTEAAVKGAAIALQIPAPNFQQTTFKIVGDAPYVQAKFSAKAKNQIRDNMLSGTRSRKGQARKPRDFKADYEGAKHISRDGWCGIPASCFRQACISACRLVGFKMTLAKLALFVEADGYDVDEGTPLVRIYGKPHMHEQHVRNATGVVDLRVRPMWNEWHAKLVVRWDADLFSAQDVTNLLNRVGQQVGIGEGRPDSKQSTGQGWGLFHIDMEG